MAYLIDESCLACRTCVEICPTSAPYFNGETYSIDAEKCVECGRCAAACVEGAIRRPHEARPAPQPVTEFASSCDFVVVGSGPAGLTAAAYAAEQGKHVILLESTQRLGGAGHYATIFMPVGTKWEADAGLPDLSDALATCAMNATNWKLNPKLVRNAYRESGKLFDWLCEWAHPEECFQIGRGFGGRIGVDLKSPALTGGHFLMPKLIERCREQGVDIRLGHRAKRLLLDGNAVRGVVAETAAGDVTIHAPHVLLATGAMTVSPDLDRFDPVYAAAKHTVNAHRFPGSTGDGVRMLEQAGIPVDTDGVCSHYLGGMPMFFDAHVLKQALRPDALKVNLNGERWTNESLERMASVGRLLPQPQGVSYTIVDSALLASKPKYVKLIPYTRGGLMVAEGLPKPGDRPQLANFMGLPVMFDENGNEMKLFGGDGAEENRGMGGYPAGSLPTDEQMRRLAKIPGGHVFVADTPEELAEAIGLPKETFCRTLARYNALCEAGQDEDFLKDPDYMLPLAQGPYYAFRTCLCTDGAFGGAFIDENCRNLNGKTPIDGLYSAGDMTSGNFIRQADNRVEMMNDFTWAFVSGWIAAHQVVG